MHVFSLLLVALPVVCCCAESGDSDLLDPQASAGRELSITIVFDNYSFDDRLKTAWGFACVIDGLEKTVLFDTGLDGEILLSNMRILGMDPKDIDIVVLSHEHGDHVNGLESLLKVNSDVSVFMPPSFSAKLKAAARAAGARVVEVEPGQKICDRLFTTGEMGRQIIEEGVYIDTGKGLVVITGCAHPGIVEIAAKAKELSGLEPYYILGGFHLRQHSDQALTQIMGSLKDLGAQKVVPTHCTGDRARELFQEAFGKSCHSGGVGAKFTIGFSDK